MENFFKLSLVILFLSISLGSVCAQQDNVKSKGVLTEKLTEVSTEELIKELDEKLARVNHLTGQLVKLKDSLQKDYNASDKKNVLLSSLLSLANDFEEITTFVNRDTVKLEQKLEKLDCYYKSEIALILLLKHSSEIDLPLIVDYSSYKSSVAKKSCYIREDEYVLKPSQINYELKYRSSLFGYKYIDKEILRVAISDEATRVDVVVRIQNRGQGLVISENTYLRDKKSGVLYKIRRIDNDIPLAELLIVPDSQGECVSFTLVFPPIGVDVKKLELISLKSNNNLGRRYEILQSVPLEFDLRLESNESIRMDKVIE